MPLIANGQGFDTASPGFGTGFALLNPSLNPAGCPFYYATIIPKFHHHVNKIF
jgi:hypothetical protein